MHVWVVSMMHANGRYEPKSAHFSEEEARWTVGSLVGSPGVAVTLSRVKVIDGELATETNPKVAFLQPQGNLG